VKGKANASSFCGKTELKFVFSAFSLLVIF